MLSSLVDLARETSSEKRRELMQGVSNLFVEGADRYTDREILRFGEVLTLLLDRVPEEDRAGFSERVATLERTPRDVAVKLANDTAEIAEPVLRHSPVLTDSDLTDIARRQGQGHLAAIAQRATLSAEVTDVLVDRGDETVLTTVTRNLGASFSEQGFSTLVEKSKSIEDLGEALSFRADMPPEIAQQLVGLLNPVARQRLEHLMARDQGKVDAMLDDARKEMDASRGDVRRSRMDCKVMLADIRAGKLTIDQAVDTLLFKNRLLDVGYLLAELASVPEAHVSNVLHKVNGMGIAVVCRSLGLSPLVYGRLSRLRCERLRLNAAQAEAMIREYETLDKDTADRTIRFHKVRSTVQAKMANG